MKPTEVHSKLDDIEKNDNSKTLNAKGSEKAMSSERLLVSDGSDKISSAETSDVRFLKETNVLEAPYTNQSNDMESTNEETKDFECSGMVSYSCPFLSSLFYSVREIRFVVTMISMLLRIFLLTTNLLRVQVMPFCQLRQASRERMVAMPPKVSESQVQSLSSSNFSPTMLVLQAPLANLVGFFP